MQTPRTIHRPGDIVGRTYAVRVSGRVVPVRIDRENGYNCGGWYGTNLITGRRLRIWSARRLLKEVHTVGGAE